MFNLNMRKMGALMIAITLILSGLAGSAVAELGDIIVAETLEDGFDNHAENQTPVEQEQTENVPPVVEQVNPAQPPVVIEQTQRETYRVEFFDFNGDSLGYVVVYEGDYLLIPEYIPEMEGFQFEYWYDLGQYQKLLQQFPYALPEAYIFGTPVASATNLFPYYTVLSKQESSMQPMEPPTVIDPVQTDALIGLITNGSGEETMNPVQPEQVAVTGEQADQLINQIISNEEPVLGIVEQAAVTNEQADELINQIISNEEPVLDNVEQAAVTDEQAGDLINQIINSNEEATTETVGQADELISQIINNEDPADDEETADIEDVATGEAATTEPLEGTTVQEVLANTNGLNIIVVSSQPQDKPTVVTTEAQEQNLISFIQSGDDEEVENEDEAELAVNEEADDESLGTIEEIISDEPANDETETDEVIAVEEEEAVTAIVEGAETGDEDESGIVQEPAVDEDDTEADSDIPDIEVVIAAAPSVQVIYEFEGDEIVPGTVVTVRAELINVPEGITATFYWMNNAGGTFQSIGETGQSFTFVADETNTNCEYQVNVTLG